MVSAEKKKRLSVKDKHILSVNFIAFIVAACGGGGGYSGGGNDYSFASNTPTGAGGGGSYNNGSNISNVAGNNSGHGKVEISW